MYDSELPELWKENIHGAMIMLASVRLLAVCGALL